MRRSVAILISAGAGLALVAAGTAAGAAIAGPIDGSNTIHGCYATKANNAGSHTVVLQDTGTNCPPNATAISWNEEGPPGTNGTNGTDGTNGKDGNSVLTSSAAPTGSCNTGDTDIDRATGEYYSCTASAWADTGQNIQPPPQPTTTALTWTITCTAVPCTGKSTDSIPVGAVLTPEGGPGYSQAGSCSVYPDDGGTISDNAGNTLADIDQLSGGVDAKGADTITATNAGPLQYSFNGDPGCYPASVTFNFEVTGVNINLTSPFN